ncbi:VCBS repeat-containing protein, partial [bacterium]|nr:VCBS repeat-containing protein [bacterium]
VIGREIALSKFFEIEVGAAPYDMAWNDVNHDGRLDYLTANYGESSATLLLSQDDESFQTQTLPSGEGCLNGLINDLNDDGEYDVLLLGGYDSTLTFYPSIDGRFTTSIQWDLPDLIELPEERVEWARIRLIAIGRFFAGQAKCIAAALPNRIVLYQYAHGEFSIKQTLAVPFSATQLAAVDFDNDGVDELLAAHVDPEYMLAYRVTPSGAETIIEHPLDANFFGNDPQDVITSDLNNDGRPDFTAITFNREIHALLSPDYSPTVFTNTIPMVVNDLEAGDFDRDGEAELILAGYDVQNQVSSLAILCGDGPTHYARVVTIPVPQAFPVGQQFNIAATDFNGDGWADAVLLDRINNRLVFFANVTPIQP